VTTCWRRFAEWAHAGVFERLQERLFVLLAGDRLCHNRLPCAANARSPRSRVPECPLKEQPPMLTPSLPRSLADQPTPIEVVSFATGLLLVALGLLALTIGWA
jgi:hypothetical protein